MNSFTKQYDKKDTNKEKEIKAFLEKKGYIFEPFNYAYWRAKGENVNATFYNSGKFLVQGKGTGDFVSKYIEKAQTANNKTKKEVKKANSHNYNCWIGTDESGKGDYFGPLVVASVMVNKENIPLLKELGVQDSKKIKDSTIEKIAYQIKNICEFSVITIMPEKYNELYDKFKNLNSLLAWGHARAIENILEKHDCKYAISDKFGKEELILNALMKKGKEVKLEQRHRAEDDIAVAAASIIARYEFIQKIKKLSNQFSMNFSKGASEKVKNEARLFLKKQNVNKLKSIAKLHFKTTKEL